MENLEKVARFEEAINKAAEAEIDALLSGAKAKADETVACADEEYLEKSYHLVSGETKNIKRKLTQMVSQKRFEASKEVFAFRNKRIEEFFDGIAKEIIEYSQSAEYEKSLAGILDDIDKEHKFSNNSVAYVKTQDEKTVKKLYPDLTVKTDKNIKLGGVTVFYPDEAIYIDKTYDNAFEQQKADFVNNSFMQLN